MVLLGPIIEERLKLLEDYGNDWVDKPVSQRSFQLPLC